ncbi:helix-turn-helix domain-containing protein [Arthrobacter sp. H14]|uniref:helix-turn-helix domain-containing protein n=1 Tax=Arthrobacter sp. H14 TaxID=1312959 RepID=UPI0004B99120|nr:helix-turn-helix domain-containing protein [Arthrobacter sp. H14]
MANTLDTPQRLLTPAEAAAVLSVKEKTLANWRSNGQGPDFIKFYEGGLVRYEAKALELWITTCRRTA